MASNLTFFPHTLTPPTTEEDRLSWIRLIRSYRVGPATFFRLLGEHGSAQAALEALPHIAKAAGVAKYSACPLPVAIKELNSGLRLGARPLFLGEADYPEALAEISDAPPLLWCLGDVSLIRQPTIALVGARNASSLGLRMANRLAADLGQAGYVIASGLARGIDTAAHRAGLPTGTIAVQAGGIDIHYPPENAGLAEEIAANGLRLSEQPPGLEPTARHFPLRNRIISGLSRAVVVIEAAPRSGSLLTARAAGEQGRDVMAVPGHPFDQRAGGCNMLIRDGALLVRGAEDVLAGLSTRLESPVARETTVSPPGSYSANRHVAKGAARGVPLNPPSSQPGLQASHRIERQTNPAQPSSAPDRPLPERILALLGPSPVTEDQIFRDLSHPLPEVMNAMLHLELEGTIMRHPGGMVSLS